MKKFKSLAFAIYLVAIVLAVVGAIVFTTIYNNKQTSSGNNNGAINSATNTSTSKTKFSLNCASEYNACTNSVLTFGEGFYTSEKDVDIRLSSANSMDGASFTNNKFSATTPGLYSLSFYIDDVLKTSILINVVSTKVNTTFNLGEEVELSNFNADNSNITLSNNEIFTVKDNSLIASKAGVTELNVTTKLNEYVTKIDTYTLKVTPILTLKDAYDEEITGNTVTVYTNDGAGAFAYEVKTSLNNGVTYKIVDITCSNSEIDIMDMGGFVCVSCNNSPATGDITIGVEINNEVTNITFTINLIEEV